MKIKVGRETALLFLEKTMKKLKIVIDNKSIELYEKYYFKKYPKRKKFPIKSPIPPSLNQWMVMKRYQMNHLKQVWKEFGNWMVKQNKLENKKLDKCRIVVEYFFGDKRKRDADNYTPKNLFDSFTVSGLLIDDDFNHVQSLTIKANYCKENPRTEITFIY